MGLSKRKIVGVIQCRTGSTRLPNKALLQLGGKSMIENYIQRVKRSKYLDEIVLATTLLSEDNVLFQIAEIEQIGCYRGSINDVADRLVRAARGAKAEVVVRLCADNPLIEPSEIDRLVEYRMSRSYTPHPCLYSNAQNVADSGYPDGIGAELYDMSSFTFSQYGDKEHPHSYFYDNQFIDAPKCPEEFAYPEVKLDVNTQEEYDFVKAIYDRFDNNEFHVTEYIKEIANV